MRKTFVIDTNVLLCDPQSIYSFGANDVVIPLVVFEELDKHKTRFDEVGRNARQISRVLDELRTKGNLFNGVDLGAGTMLRVVSLYDVPKIPELKNSSVDNMIIFYMLELKNKGIPSKLITKDINMRLKCDSLGMVSEDYVKLIVNTIDDLYSGVGSLVASQDDLDAFYDSECWNFKSNKTFYPNQIIILSNGVKTSGIARCLGKNNEGDYELVRVSDYSNVFGLKPRNKEQNFSLDLLLDPNIKLLTITGKAGSGKSLLTIASALQQLKMPGNVDGVYEKIIISRPIQPLGKDLGFLPGTLEEKLDPWITPIKDNISFLMRNKNSRKNAAMAKETYLQLLQERGLVELEAITYIRGRSIANAFILIDEAQNLTVHELKTIVTRVGEGTKIVLNGDVEQIDNSNVNFHDNALTYAIEKFKHSDIAGHITLLKGERSQLATLAAEIL